MKKNKFFQWLKRPHGAPLALVYVLTVCAVVGASVLAALGTAHLVPEIVSYVVFALAAVLFGYTVYTVVIYVPVIKRKIVGELKKHKFTANILENYGFKTVLFSTVSFGITVAFAVMNFVSAIRYGLIWYYAISAYYAALIIFRGGIILADRKCKKRCGGDAGKYRYFKWKIYLSGGAFLVVVDLSMMGAVTQLLLSRKPMQSGMIMAIANAAYTFLKMGMAIRNLVKARKYDDPVVQALRNINFADACMSVVSLTVLMCTTFDDGASTKEMLYMKCIVGFVACAIITVMASLMIIGAARRLRRFKYAAAEAGDGTALQEPVSTEIGESEISEENTDTQEHGDGTSPADKGEPTNE